MALLGVYAIFFTPLSQTLSRQYQAQIADETEQLTELRRENFQVSEQLQATRGALAAADEGLSRAQTELAAENIQKQDILTSIQQANRALVALRGQNAQAEHELSKTRMEVSRLRAEVASLDVQRRNYVGPAIRAAYSFLFLQPVKSEVTALRSELREDRAIIDMPKWWKSEQSFYSSIRHLNLSEQMAAIGNHTDPGISADEDTVFSLELGFGDPSRIPESQVAEFVDNARRRAVAAFREHPVTGFQLLHEYFVRDRFRLLFDDDWAKLKAHFDSIVQANYGSLNSPLRLPISQTSTDVQIEYRHRSHHKQPGRFRSVPGSAYARAIGRTTPSSGAGQLTVLPEFTTPGSGLSANQQGFIPPPRRVRPSQVTIDDPSCRERRVAGRVRGRTPWCLVVCAR